MVGFYVDSSGVTHRYLLNGTTLKTLNRAMDTAAFGINNNGEIVGIYVDASMVQHGFVYQYGVWQTVDDPNGVGTATINGLNDKGQLVGFYGDGADKTVGFVANVVPEPGILVLLARDCWLAWAFCGAS